MASKNKKDYTGTIVSIDNSGKVVRTTPKAETNKNTVTKVNSNTSNLVSTPTVTANTTVPKMSSQQMANKNYNDKLSIFNKASEAYDKKRIEELNKNNIDLTRKLDKQDFRNNVQDGRVVNKKTMQEREKQYEQFQPKLDELTQAEHDAKSKAENDLKLATYQKAVADTDNKNPGLLDKIAYPFIGGIGNMFSTVTQEDRYIDENGNTIYLPSENDLIWNKVRESYGNGHVGNILGHELDIPSNIRDNKVYGFLGDVARFGGDVMYESGKQAASKAMNVVPYLGTTLYFSDIIADQYKQNINEGYDEEKSMKDALLKGGANYIKQKIIGGLGGKLTNSDTSWLEKSLTKKWANVVSNPRAISALSSMSSEAIDEFTDTFVEAGIDAAVLGKKFDGMDLLKDAVYSAGIGAGTGFAGGAVKVSPEAQLAALNRQNALNNQNTVQNNTNVSQNNTNVTQQATQDVQPTTQTETPQIQTNGQDNINTQPRLEQQQIDLKQGNNEVSNQTVGNKPLVDTRTNEDISNRKVNAYQFDNPEVKPYFRDAALDLRSALENYTTKGERFMREDGTFGGTKFSSTPEITELKQDYKMSKDDIERGINGIIRDEGQENNAASKKVEVVIDKMLRNGYQSETPDTTSPNQDYINTLSGKPTNQEATVEEDLPFFTGEEETNTTQQETQPVENNNLAERKSEDVIKQELTPKEEEQHFIDEGVDHEVAKILSEMPKPEKTPLNQRIKEGKATLREEWNYFKRNFVDKGETIYRLAKKLKNFRLYAKYDKMGTTRGEANYAIGKGQTDLNGKLYNNFTDENGNKVSMSLNQIWEGIDNDVANEYLAHWLNIDRYNQETQDGQNKYVFGSPDITPEISKARIKELRKNHPELKTFGRNVWQYGRNMLQNMVDGGLISQQQADQFKSETPHYVRLQRNIDNNANTSLDFDDNGHVKVNKQIKEFKGSSKDILPFKNSMADYTFDVAKAIRTNLFAQELGKVMSLSSTDDNVSSLDESFGIRPDLLSDNGDGTYSLTAFNNGVATVIPIDQGIYESLTPSKHYNFENKMLFKGIRKVDNIRKALLTDKNPMFLATNMMKDAFDAPLNSKYPVEFAKNYPRAVKEILTNGEYYQQYQALGGLQNSYFEKSEFQKDGSKLNPLTWIEKGNNAIEQFPRLAEFISTMEKTGDIDEAMYNAAEITTNFKRGGDVTKAANRNGVTFLNASVQGFDKQIRNFTDIQSPKQAVQLLGKIVVLGIAPAIINDVMYKDDEEYKEMQDYIKDRYYLFKGKNGDWIRIPKGRAVSVFQSAARRTGYALDGDENAFKDFANFASTQVAPNNPFENNIISPLVDVARNESWSGNKIVSDSKSNKEHPDEEYNEKTDEFSKWLGKQLNASPMKINYLIDQYSGGVGDVVLPTITPKTTSKTTNPIEQAFASKFTTDPVYSNKNVSVFYDTKEKYENEKKSVKGTKMDKLKYSYLNSQGLKISDLYKEQSKIQSDNSLSNKEKYEKAREIQKQINELAKKSVKDIDNIQDNKYYAIVGDNIYYLKDNDDGTQSFAKDGYADSHKKSAEKKGMALYDYYKESYEKRKEKK